MAAEDSKTICLYVSDEIQTFLKWSIRQYTKNMNIAYCRKTDRLEAVLKAKDVNILFIDLPPQNEPVAPYLKKIIENNPEVNILLVVPPTINRDEAMQVIREKLVKGILVLPFSAEVVCNYINKINC
jgi:hypothetical protein